MSISRFNVDLAIGSVLVIHINLYNKTLILFAQFNGSFSEELALLLKVSLFFIKQLLFLGESILLLKKFGLMEKCVRVGLQGLLWRI